MKIELREITMTETVDPHVMDEQQSLDLKTFAQVCGQTDDWVKMLLEHDILTPQPYGFIGEDVSRARRAYRLQRDFDASLPAVAVMLDLIDEVQQLRQQLQLHVKD